MAGDELAALTAWPLQAQAIISFPVAESWLATKDNATLEATFTSTFLLFSNANFTPYDTTEPPTAFGYDTSNATTKAPLRPSTPTRSGAPDMPLWLIAGYCVVLLFAVVGNLLVISTLIQNRRMRTITNVFLLNLAISDILLGVLCMPVTLVGALLRHFIFGEYFCKLIQFSQAASVAVSSWTLVAISCERYYAICHPLRSRRWQTRSHAYKIIGCIWCGSMLCMMPIALFSQLMPTSRQGYRKCRENWPSYALPYERSFNLFLDLVLLVLPLVILSVAYILITRTLYVGMRIEKAMIFGGSCNGKLNSDEIYTQTCQRRWAGSSSYAPYPQPATSLSTTTLASTSTSMSSRFKFNLSLRRPGHMGNINSNAASSNARQTLYHHKTNSEGSDQEMETFQQQQQQKLYHHQIAMPRGYQHQPQSHYHNYHQHQQIVLYNGEETEPSHVTMQPQPQGTFNKLCCENVTRLCCGGRRATTSMATAGGGGGGGSSSSNGRRHLYCMRFATLKTLPDNDSINGTSSFGISECCSSSCSGCANNGSSIIGNMPSTSSSSAAAAAAASTASTCSYRYQMQQHPQQPPTTFSHHYQHPHPHQQISFSRNYQMQQVPPEYDGRGGEGRKLFSSKRNLRSSDSVLRRNNIAKNLESKKRVVKMLFVLVLEFFICWTPLYVINTVAMYIGATIYEYIDYKSISALQLLAYSSSCCNPITYCFMNANFRRAFLDTFKGWQWCGRRFKRKQAQPQNGNLGLAGSSSIRVNSCTVQTVIDSPRL